MTAARTATKDLVYLDTSEYVASHGRKPQGRGGWMFRNAATGYELSRNGTYTEARKALWSGTWVVLP